MSELNQLLFELDHKKNFNEHDFNKIIIKFNKIKRNFGQI